MSPYGDRGWVLADRKRVLADYPLPLITLPYYSFLKLSDQNDKEPA